MRVKEHKEGLPVTANVIDTVVANNWCVGCGMCAGMYTKDAKKITLVMDNLNTHKPGSLYEAFSPEEAKRIWDRFEFVYTSKHGSWLNMAEIELNVLVHQCLSRRIDSLAKVHSAVSAWQTIVTISMQR